jgi:3-methyladenine DNA glycosylase AlkD
MAVEDILEELKENSNPEKVKGMMRYGINPDNTLGVSMPDITAISKKYKRDHTLALSLWDTGVHEAKILAALVDDHKKLTEEQMESWVKDFDSWDVCDQVIMKLFDKSPIARSKALEWADREEEYVRRAGFAMMASIALHYKKLENSYFDDFFDMIIKRSDDNRNFVKKAVNWALRQIGKRNHDLRIKAIETASKIIEMDTKPGNWIARDAIRELESEKTIDIIDRKENKKALRK